MPESALTPQAAVERLGGMSTEIRAAILVGEHGGLTAHTGADARLARRLEERARELFRAADAAGARAGVDPVARVEVTRQDGGVFGVRERHRGGGLWTIVAVTAAGALSSLVLYDMRMTLRSIGAPA